MADEVSWGRTRPAAAVFSGCWSDRVMTDTKRAQQTSQMAPVSPIPGYSDPWVLPPREGVCASSLLQAINTAKAEMWLSDWVAKD